MTELLLSVVKVGLPLSVIASVSGQGLAISAHQLTLFWERPFLLVRSLVGVLILVPAAALLIVLSLKPSAAVAIGLAVLAASPVAPMLFVKIPKKGGSPAYAASLHLSLALLAAITVPITLQMLAAPLGFSIDVGALAVAGVVGKTILLPVCVGLLIRALFPAVADTIGPPLLRAGGISLMILVLLVVVMTYGLLLKMDLWSYLVMAVVVAVAIAIGHWLAPQQPEEQATLALESAVRNPGLAMMIAASNFGVQESLPVLVPYMAVSSVITMLYLRWRKVEDRRRVEAI